MPARLFPLILSALLSLGAVALAFALGNDPIDQAHMAARWTARVGFPIFILTYSASSLVRLWPSDATKRWMRYRRQWGLGFALAHTVHLAALASFLMLSREPPKLATLVGGGGAYVLLYAMALTSNDASMHTLGPWWKRLHTLGIHWLWFVFAFSYFGRIFDPARWTQGVVFFAVSVAALGLRLAAGTKARRKREAVA